MLVFKQGVVLVYSVTAVILHEYGHFIVGKYYGYTMKEVNLLPYGAVLYGKEDIEKNAEKNIALAGPLVNLVLAMITISIWWIIPVTYYYTLDFFRINILIALVNLMPAFPLDGARIVLSVTKNRLTVLKFLRISGISLSFVFLAAFVASAFYKINFTTGIFAVFLFLGATGGTEKESYSYVLNTSFAAKSVGNGVIFRQIFISENFTLLKILRMISTKYLTEFIVVDGGFNKLYSLNEKQVGELFGKYPLNTRLYETYSDFKNLTEK